MKVKVKIDPGICNFPVSISATSDDGVHVDLELVTECESMLQLAKLIHEITPIDAYQELGPKESLILEAAPDPYWSQRVAVRPVLFPQVYARPYMWQQTWHCPGTSP